MLMCVALDAIAVIYVYLDVCCLGRYRRVWLRGLFITRKNTLIQCMWQVAIVFICVYLDVRVHRGGCWPGSKKCTYGGRFSYPKNVFLNARNISHIVFLDSAPNRRAWLRGLLITRKITLILCMWQVAIIFICVYLDVQVLICVYLDVRVAGRYRIYLRNPSNIYKLK
jgi:hypothetical protein